MPKAHHVAADFSALCMAGKFDANALYTAVDGEIVEKRFFTPSDDR